MRSFDWELLPYFLAVARAGSLRSAARLMNANYGTVNRNIQALEASYGVRLFLRSRRGFSLTEAGEALLPLVEKTEQTVLAARKRVEGLDKTETGSIRFSLSPTLAYDIISPIIGRFHEKYPDIQIEMRLTAEVESISNDETDISLRAARAVDDDVVARKLFNLAVGVYASNSYIDTVVAEAGPMGEGLSWIGFPGDFDTDKWLTQSPFPHAEIRHMVSDGYMRAHLVQENCGLSHLPVFFERIFPDLRRVPNTELTCDQSLWILFHSDLQKTIRVRRFVDHLTEELLNIRKNMQAGGH